MSSATNTTTFLCVNSEVYHILETPRLIPVCHASIDSIDIVYKGRLYNSAPIHKICKNCLKRLPHKG